MIMVNPAGRGDPFRYAAVTQRLKQQFSRGTGASLRRGSGDMAGPDNDMVIARPGSARAPGRAARGAARPPHPRGARACASSASGSPPWRETGDLGERLAPHAGEGSAGGARRAGRPADRPAAAARPRPAPSANSSTASSPRRCTKPWPSSATASRRPTRGSPNCAESTAPAQLVGRPLSELVHPDFAELMAEHLRRHRDGARRAAAPRGRAAARGRPHGAPRVLASRASPTKASRRCWSPPSR